MDAHLFAILDQGAMVLCASQRLAHRLRLEYATLAQQQGRMVWPTPRILTLNAWMSDVFKQQRQSRIAVPRLCTDLQTIAIWESIVTQSDRHSLLSPVQAARSALHSWQLLHQYQIPLSTLDDFDSEEARVFTHWSNEFVSYSTQHNLLDTARLPAFLMQNDLLHNDVVTEAQLVLTGFDALPPAVSALLNHLRQQGSVVTLQEMPCINKAAHVIALKDADEELQMAARWSRHQVEQGKQRVGVIVQNLNSSAQQVQRIFNSVLIPASRSALHDYALAFSLASSASLGSYPLVHHALLCLELIQDDSDIELWGQILRSPFIAGYEEEATHRALLDLKLRKSNRAHWKTGEVSRTAHACPIFSAALQVLSGLKQELPDKALPSQWVTYFDTLLASIGWAKGRTLFSEEQQTRNKFYEVLTQLGSLDEIVNRVSVTAAQQLLRNACQQSRFAPESNELPITVIDADTAAGMQFDALWITGLHANDWPPPPEPDPFIPYELQRQFGVRSSRAESCLQMAKDKLQRLVNSATEVMISWPEHEKDVELAASSLLHWPLLTPDEVPRAKVPTLVQNLFHGKPELELFTDVQLPLHPGGLIKQGSRVFELQSRCAFRAQAELRLHARSPETVEPGISPLDRGKLIHRVLQELWGLLGDSDGLHVALQTETTLRNRVRQSAERHAQSLFVADRLYQQRLIRIEVDVAVNVVMALLIEESRREPFSVVSSEQSETYSINGLELCIQPDRIDQLVDKTYLLLDYKTGENYHAKDWLDINDAGRPRSPQLPLYALAHAEGLSGIAYAILAPGVAELRGLASRDGIASHIRSYEHKSARSKIDQVDNWPQLLEHWNAVMQSLAFQFKQGVATVSPLVNECQYCSLTALCRIKEQLADQMLDDKALDDEVGDDE